MKFEVNVDRLHGVFVVTITSGSRSETYYAIIDEDDGDTIIIDLETKAPVDVQDYIRATVEAAIDFYNNT